MKHIIQKVFLFLSLLLFFSSCEEIMFEDNISKETVILMAPANQAQFNSTGINFNWEAIQYADGYRLQIARPNFTDPIQIVLDTLITTTSFSQQLNVGSYQWRIKAVTTSYETAFSNRFFTIIDNNDFQDNTVTLSSPINNLITNATTQELTWISIIDAVNYQIIVIDNDNKTVIDKNSTTNSITIDFPEGTHQWKVRASSGSQQTLYASRSILIDTIKPNQPILTSPPNQSKTKETTISFQWNRTPIAGSAEKDSIYIYTNQNLSSLLLKTEATSLFSKGLNKNTYYWLVQSFDVAGNIGEQSTISSFTIE